MRSHWTIIQYDRDDTCNHPCMASGKPRSPLNLRFGKRLGALRKENKWTFVYLAEHSGLDESFLVRLEQGQQEPCLNTQDILAKSFGLTISELMRGV
jgi:DNA-binding XRE family transcriptional regulator